MYGFISFVLLTDIFVGNKNIFSLPEAWYEIDNSNIKERITSNKG